MHTDERKPAGDWHPATGHTDHASIRAAAAAGEEIDTLRAEFALRGHALHVRAAGGFYVERWGLRRDLLTIAEVRGFLAQIGGAA